MLYNVKVLLNVSFKMQTNIYTFQALWCGNDKRHSPPRSCFSITRARGNIYSPMSIGKPSFILKSSIILSDGVVSCEIYTNSKSKEHNLIMKTKVPDKEPCWRLIPVKEHDVSLQWSFGSFALARKQRTSVV